MFNKEDFRNSKPEIMRIINKDLGKGRGIRDVVTNLGLSYGIPLICIYEFVLEDMPEFKEDCEFKIKELKEFYGIR